MSIALTIHSHEKDLGGGFIVRRLLPSAARQSVGPFLFLDHFGPITLLPENNTDVRPHPHIGLATVTYLFSGAMDHRDSLGYAQRIEPGAINWMTAGRGIVHSERTPPDLRNAPRHIHGLQLWAALPLDSEEVEPSFIHTPAAAIPEIINEGTVIRVLIGSAFGATSPVNTFSRTLYLDIAATPGSVLALPEVEQERAVYSVDNDLLINGTLLPAGVLAVLASGTANIQAAQGARYVVLGGEPLDGHRFMWWNFVSSRKERIAVAQNDWEAQQMGSVPDESEFIPLPPRNH